MMEKYQHRFEVNHLHNSFEKELSMVILSPNKLAQNLANRGVLNGARSETLVFYYLPICKKSLLT